MAVPDRLGRALTALRWLALYAAILSIFSVLFAATHSTCSWIKLYENLQDLALRERRRLSLPFRRHWRRAWQHKELVRLSTGAHGLQACSRIESY